MFCQKTPAADWFRKARPVLSHCVAEWDYRQQFSPDARPAIGAPALGMDGFDVDQQRLITQMAMRCRAGAAHEVIVLARHAYAQYPALHRDGPHAPVALDEGVIQR